MTQKRYKLGLALSGGGARGFAHLGAIQALKEHGICPDCISGVSAGALAGTFIAAGFEPFEILELFDNLSFMEFTDLSFRQAGFSKTTKIQAFVRKYVKVDTFEELKIPLTVVATNFDVGKSAYFSTGPLAAPVAASCSFPIVFAPTKIDGVHYSDGGLFMNFPVRPIREECDKVIGINISPISPNASKNSFRDVLEKCIFYLLDGNAAHDTSLCDVLISPVEVSHHSLFEVKSARKIFDIGYQYTLDLLKTDKKLQNLLP